MTISTVNWLQAVVDAIAAEDARIGGLRQTRVISAVATDAYLAHPYTWDGTDTVLAPDTSEVSAGDWLRLVDGGRPFKALAVTPGVSVTIDPAGQAIPTGPTAVLLGGTITWNGTTTVVFSAVPRAQITTGMWIRRTTTGFWFKIQTISAFFGNYNVVIENPHGAPIPTGVNLTYKSIEPRTAIIGATLGVETTLGWPDAGSIALDGIWYRYGAKSTTPAEFQDITREENGVVTPGFRQVHAPGAVVTDLTGAWSGIDRLIRSVLVDYAEGQYLNALGRNLGVMRYPFLESDDVFREIIKALAYNPRGTIFGLELALDAMVGPGNYILWEDLINYPCTVFIQLLGDATVSDRSAGKTYLTGVEHRRAATTTAVVISGSVISRGVVHSIQIRPEDHFGDYRNQKPSADLVVEYDGGPSTAVWTYGGANEGIEVTQIAGEAVEITHTSPISTPQYTRTLRCTSSAYMSLQMVLSFRSSGTWSLLLADMDQWGARIADASKNIYWATREYAAGSVEIGLTSNLTTFLGQTAVLAKDVYHQIEVRKFAQSHVELIVNGQLVDTQLISAFGAGFNRIAIWGSFNSGLVGPVVRVKHVAFYSKVTDDYWAKRGGVSTSVVTPSRITSVVGVFQAGDVGKQITLQGATAMFGRANGEYEVKTFVAGTAVDVQGKLNAISATLSIGVDDRIVVPRSGKQFLFPDDIGKQIEIVDSDQGNNGLYTITALHDPDTDTDMALWDTWLPTRTNIAIVTPPGPAVTESGLSWRLNPNFVTDSGIIYELSAAGTVTGSNLTLRQALPYAPIVVDVAYSAVLSALIMLDFSIKNEIVQYLPDVLWGYYPFYLTDPLGFLRAYLDDLTAAGVIPEYRVA